MARMVAFAELSRNERRARTCRRAGSPSCKARQKPTTRFHRNQQYSVTALTDASGSIVERYAYTAYGQPTFLDGSGTVLTSSAEDNRYTYTGREWDETLGLYHYRARMYDAAEGRFLGRDPIGYWGGDFSLYGYVLQCPLSWLDPLGLQVDINLFPTSENIHKKAENVPDDPRVFTVGGHGNSGGVYGPNGTLIPASDLVDDIRNHPDYQKGMPVQILSCNVGNGTYPQEVADGLGCKVAAACSYIWFWPNGDTRIGPYAPGGGFDPNGEQQPTIFTPNPSPSPPKHNPPPSKPKKPKKPKPPQEPACSGPMGFLEWMWCNYGW